MKTLNKALLVMFALIFLDFLTTLVGVGVMKYHESNLLVKSLYDTNNYFSIWIFSLFFLPLIWLGIISLLKKERHKLYFTFLIILLYAYVVTHNFMQFVI